MTRNDFIEMVEQGGDIMFDCGDKHFIICYWTDCPIYIAEQVTEENSAEFSTVEELLEQYMIDGVPLKDHIDKIKITFRS